MATHLQQLLQSVCWNADWKYAVFWKLKHDDQMVLTWEDAWYCDHFNNNTSESKIFSDAHETLHDGHFASNSIALAVAKMSYHVYSHGKGIVSEVAVTGKHRWIHAADYLMNPCSLSEPWDGWQEQFSAGIKTIVVASVFPHGVVQLGSLNNVDEDQKLLAHIRDLFSSFQYSSACHVQNPVEYSPTSAMADTSTINSCPDVFQECLIDYDKLTNNVIDNCKLIQPVAQNHDSNSLLNDAKRRCNNYRVQNSVNLESAVCSPTAIDGEAHPFEGKFSELTTLGNYNCSGVLDSLESSFLFSTGYELHEALGSAALKQCYPWSHEDENIDNNSISNVPDITENSMITSDSGSDHLLEAVVANFCHRDVPVKKTASFSTSESMLTTEKMPEPSINTNPTVGSSCYSMGCSSILEESIRKCLNSSDSCTMRSSTSACKRPTGNPVGVGKTNKKRARPGENPRPRPRDRQLIQDRIKELRDLVPDGSKCSIDSLLERTIKHMFFLQSVTKHANKLSSCAESRRCSNETGVPSSGFEQGSSWAVEVGGHMKICPIVVENLNANGQMLIEMLCEDSDHFLKIAEVIKSLGLTILKGATDYHDDKIWMRFVVEGQNNITLHRVDVLWSLVQILQSDTTI